MNSLLLLALLALDAGTPTAPAPGLRFIEDDYPKALATAKAEKKTLLVDAWAPWCHSCIFMREHVFTRPEFKAFDTSVVFASIDTERTAAAPFLEKYPVSVWPTLFFIDPATETVMLKWVGSADERQMQALLSSLSTRGALAQADREMARGRLDSASKTYLSVKEPSARATLSTLAALSLAGQHEACATTAVERLPQLTSNADRANAVSWGLGCALEMPAGKPRLALLAKLRPAAQSLLTADDVLADDASGLYEQLVDDATARKESGEASALALQWLSFLEKAAARASTPAARAVFDPHRVNAAIAAGHPERAVEALNASALAFPTDYNPPARLALLYRELKQFDQALTAANRALSLCTEGPRKLRLWENKASIQVLTGDKAGAQKTLTEALTWARALPKAQVSEKRISGLAAQLKALGGVTP